MRLTIILQSCKGQCVKLSSVINIHLKNLHTVLVFTTKITQTTNLVILFLSLYLHGLVTNSQCLRPDQKTCPASPDWALTMTSLFSSEQASGDNRAEFLRLTLCTGTVSTHYVVYRYSFRTLYCEHVQFRHLILCTGTVSTPYIVHMYSLYTFRCVQLQFPHLMLCTGTVSTPYNV